jgi:hypothetical protein
VNALTTVALDIWGKDIAIWIPTYSSITGEGNSPNVIPFPGHIIPEVPAGTDLVTDGGFESGLWTPVTSAAAGVSITHDPTKCYQGTAAAAFDQTSAHAQQILTNIVGTIATNPSDGTFDGRLGKPVPANGILQVTGTGMWVSPNGTALGGVAVDVFDATGAFIGELIGPTWVTETSYTPKTNRYVLAAAAAFVVINAFCDGTSGGGTLYVDEVHATIVTLPSDEVVLTDAATIAVDATMGTRFKVTLGGNRTMGAPTGQYQNQRITFRIVQDGTGSRTLAWNAAFKVSWSDTGNTANKQSTIAFYWNGTNWVQDGAQSPYV